MPRNGSFRAAALLFCFCPFVRSSALEITSPSALPDGVRGEPYNFQLRLEAAAGQVTWSVDTGETDYVQIETPHHFAEPAAPPP